MNFVGQAGVPGDVGNVGVSYRLEYRSTISEIGSPTHTMLVIIAMIVAEIENGGLW